MNSRNLPTTLLEAAAVTLCLLLGAGQSDQVAMLSSETIAEQFCRSFAMDSSLEVGEIIPTNQSKHKEVFSEAGNMALTKENAEMELAASCPAQTQKNRASLIANGLIVRCYSSPPPFNVGSFCQESYRQVQAK